MRVELERGRMNARRLRLYHSMYQLFSFTMLMALTTNNLGLPSWAGCLGSLSYVSDRTVLRVLEPCEHRRAGAELSIWNRDRHSAFIF
jgi:hypothetical protein